VKVVKSLLWLFVASVLLFTGYVWGVLSAPIEGISAQTPMAINCFKVDNGFVQYCSIDDWDAKALRVAVSTDISKP